MASRMVQCGLLLLGSTCSAFADTNAAAGNLTLHKALGSNVRALRLCWLCSAASRSLLHASPHTSLLCASFLNPSPPPTHSNNTQPHTALLSLQ